MAVEADGDDHPVPDTDGGGSLAGFQDNAPRADDEVERHKAPCQALPGSEASSRTTEASMSPYGRSAA